MPLPAPSIADEDSDVVAGFPYGRLTLMILYANMMLGGFWYTNLTLEPMANLLEPGREPQRRVSDFESGIEMLHNSILKLADQYPIILMIVPMLGTVGGLAWYLVLRWRESKLIRKRREALLATLNPKIEAVT